MKTCIASYQTWLGKGSSGESVTWDNDKEKCTKQVFAFEGTPVASKQAIDDALKAKYGRACGDWRVTKTANTSYVSPGGNPETKNPECGGVQYWFHKGKEFTNKEDWTKRDNEIKEQACISNRSKVLSENKSGKYTYGPTPGPEPCGKVVWLCNGQELTTEADYKTTSCGATPPPPPPKPQPKPPKTVVDPVTRKKVSCPGTKPAICNNRIFGPRDARCKCWRNL